MLSRFMIRREQLVLLFVGSSIVLGSLVILYMQFSGPEIPAGEPVEDVGVQSPYVVQESEPAQQSPGDLDVTVIVVSVQGAVEQPEVYRLSPGQRVQDALDLAGGVKPLANTDTINLAARLVDGTTLYIPGKHDTDSDTVSRNHGSYILTGGGSTLSSGSSSASVTLIDINTATQTELESLPGIGPAYATAIITYRSRQPFRRPEEVLAVRGIGEKRFEGIRDLITVR